MKRMLLPLVVLAGFVDVQPSLAQDGCQTVRSSCTQMLRTCESRCQTAARNPSACVAMCSTGMDGCRANGVWKANSSPACWRTSNRS